jgi:hypothetical protein
MIRNVQVDEEYDFSYTITFILRFHAPSRKVFGAVFLYVLVSSALLLATAPQASQQRVTVVR